MLVQESLIPSIIPTLYFYFGGKDWKIPMIPSMIFSTISFVLSIFIPESPRYLYAKKNWKGFRKVIKTIAEINQTKMKHDYEIDEEVKNRISISNDAL